MFRLIWNPAVNAMCAIIDSMANEQLGEEALNGLQVCVGGERRRQGRKYLEGCKDCTVETT